MTTQPARQGFNAPAPVSTTPSTQATQVEQARAVAEVQAAVVVAQQVPRDMDRALGDMRNTCSRLAVAERAFYRVPNRGEGPSVHLARELARIWGNIQYGVHELRRDDLTGMSEVQAFAWDVQTNSRSTRTFQVPHKRMKGKAAVDLTDLNDVYLNNQNVGARAVRECIFTVLPGWFTEEAQQVAQKALREGEGEPLESRIDKAVTAFSSRFTVRQDALEKKLEKKRGQWDAGDISRLMILYRSLEQGETTVDEEFPAPAPEFEPAPTA